MDILIDEGMVQGWTRRYDCILHSHILLYVTAKLWKKGILSAGEGYKGKVMIDDALFCFFFSRKSTKLEKEKKCLLIEDAITEAYAEVGLVIAKDKMIISTLNFTFLNRFFSKGAEVVKPIRTMMKVCTSADRMITTFQGQVQDVTGSIRGAIEKGADPMEGSTSMGPEHCHEQYNQPDTPDNCTVLTRRVGLPLFCGLHKEGED